MESILPLRSLEILARIINHGNLWLVSGVGVLIVPRSAHPLARLRMQWLRYTLPHRGSEAMPAIYICCKTIPPEVVQRACISEFGLLIL